eukprot:TRINITY_DN29358_c0_g1_i1.p1 TRINITY_DN29358_c0_g1~~TRINITY_DN29358_c0_g1_i1.p1  ORF type:complete len:389 (+),score=46.47 TRINITY_DN29358_c0_g1_i1:55-1221(+)
MYCLPDSMAHYIAPLEPNINSSMHKVKLQQPITDPLKITWTCPMCTKTMPQFVRECHMKLHAMFCCPKCSNEYPLSGLGPHLLVCMTNTPDQFTCGICGSINGSVRHIKVKHITKLTCSIPGCGKTFSIDGFGGHSKTCIKTYTKRSQSNAVSIPNLNPVKVVEPVKSRETQSECYFCTNMYSTDAMLQNHIDKVHIKHTCPFCLARGISEAKFDDHIKRCLKKLPNPEICPMCGKSIPNNPNHIHKIHANLKISCPSCRQKHICLSLAKHTLSCQKTSNVVSKVSAPVLPATQADQTPNNLNYERIPPVTRKIVSTPKVTAATITSLSEEDFPALIPDLSVSQKKPVLKQIPLNYPHNKQLTPPSSSDSETDYGFSIFYDDELLNPS